MFSRSRIALLSLTTLWLASSSVMAQSADTSAAIINPFSPAAGHPYRHGVVPTQSTLAKMKHWAGLHRSAANAITGSETLSYSGGTVISATPVVYLVVMGNQWGNASTDANGNLTLSNDPVHAVPYLQQMFKGLGTGGELWSGTLTQYCDGPLVPVGATSCPAGAPNVAYPKNGVYAGIWYDNTSSSPAVATFDQLAQEAIAAATHFGNTTAASNRYTQYVILSPTGTNPDGFNTPAGNFCAWHSAAYSSFGSVAFTNMPYVSDGPGGCGANLVNSGAAGLLDGFSIVNGHEYAETVTDMLPESGWANNVTGSSYEGQEIGDECVWITTGAQSAIQNVTMATGNFAMQSLWSNDTNACNISHPIVTGGGSGGGGGGGGGPTCFTAWGATNIYTQGATVSYNGTNYTAAYWTQGNNPATNSGTVGSGQPWVSDGSCGSPPPPPGPTPWVAGGTYTAGQQVSYNGSIYVALVNQTDWAGTGWNPTVGNLFRLVSSPEMGR